MTTSLPVISLSGLALSFVPALAVVGLLIAWQARPGYALWALARMLAQLVAVGYVLVAIFRSDNPLLIGLVLAVMLLAAAWIAIRHEVSDRRSAYGSALIAISVAGLPVLALITRIAIGIEPWFAPRFLVPLAGMTFAAAMNAVSLASERFRAEILRGEESLAARRAAFAASLIPVTNSLLAVGLVSLPGMMTGQILSGVSPLIAVRYQVVVMTMLFGVSGIASALYLQLRLRRRQRMPSA
ncbi:MAG: iron export ABC transporter permease subunit FetB [Geothermobacteraceae bacterium]